MEQSAGKWCGAQNYHRCLEIFFCKKPGFKMALITFVINTARFINTFWAEEKTVNSDSM
jgi:hypothetical protein